jgi:hypothetical protein
MDQAFTVIGRIASSSLFTKPEVTSLGALATCALGIGIMIGLEWLNRDRQYGLQMDGRALRPVRYGLYYGLIAIIIWCAPLEGGEFIYFQF